DHVSEIWVLGRRQRTKLLQRGRRGIERDWLCQCQLTHSQSKPKCLGKGTLKYFFHRSPFDPFIATSATKTGLLCLLIHHIPQRSSPISRLKRCVPDSTPKSLENHTR